MAWPCYLIERLDLVELGLRRYADGPCPDNPGKLSYHNRTTLIGTLRRKAPPPTGTEKLAPPVAKYAGDPRWPTRCSCGYRFRKRDKWQVWTDRLWRRQDGQAGRFTLRNAGIGAMFDAWWMHEFRLAEGGYVGPDGLALSVVLPPAAPFNYWHIDGPSTSGGRWSRSGTPPLVTVTPSIATPWYHGYLGRDEPGVLTDPL